MTSTLARPLPEKTAELARQIHAAWLADPEMPVVLDGCTKYNDDWTCAYGQTLIAGYTAAGDAASMVVEAVKALAVKSAVFELTGGDEMAAELPVSVPVDATIHALTAQFTILSRVQARTGHPFVHSTVNEHIMDTPWRVGDYTHQVYRAAFGPLPERYWIDADEAERRRQVLDGMFAGIGLTERGMASAVDFAAA